MIAKYLLTKFPTPATDADYAKVKVLKDIGEMVASGAIRDSTNENYVSPYYRLGLYGLLKLHDVKHDQRALDVSLAWFRTRLQDVFPNADLGEGGSHTRIDSMPSGTSVDVAGIAFPYSTLTQADASSTIRGSSFPVAGGAQTPKMDHSLHTKDPSNTTTSHLSSTLAPTGNDSTKNETSVNATTKTLEPRKRLDSLKSLNPSTRASIMARGHAVERCYGAGLSPSTAVQIESYPRLTLLNSLPAAVFIARFR
ncbi:hypothetical protein F5878DRAFT_678424 [Lentinula raphanica]|uniref:Uncharacterized protein n=1 Tax=Lentinula raphanica TaxID=153919 RepID=A0AA38NUU4_9AGAR|nr:hypothetical protein F5878DRAFT_678424 [Lentinula raphanica]